MAWLIWCKFIASLLWNFASQLRQRLIELQNEPVFSFFLLLTHLKIRVRCGLLQNNQDWGMVDSVTDSLVQPAEGSGLAPSVFVMLLNVSVALYGILVGLWSVCLTHRLSSLSGHITCFLHVRFYELVYDICETHWSTPLLSCLWPSVPICRSSPPIHSPLCCPWHFWRIASRLCDDCPLLWS